MDNNEKNLIPVEGHSNLFRDRSSGAIIYTDKSGYLNYIRMKDKKQKESDEINQIKSDIKEIKSLLQEILNGPK